MATRLPDDLKVGELLLPELRSRGLMFKGHLAEAGPCAEELVRGAWRAVEPQLEGGSLIEYLAKNLIFLFAGTPGGGTAWFSRLLTALGKPCGHESVFRACGTPRAKRVKESAPWSDSSGFASQWLSMMPGLRVTGLVRHPVDACNSMIGNLHWPASRAIEYWVQTHDRDWPAWVHVESCFQTVSELTGRPIEHVEHVASRTPRNEHKYDRELAWTDLPLAARWVALNRYGYEDGGLTT